MTRSPWAVADLPVWPWEVNSPAPSTRLSPPNGNTWTRPLTIFRKGQGIPGSAAPLRSDLPRVGLKTGSRAGLLGADQGWA